MNRPKIALDARMIRHSGIGTHLRGLLEGFTEIDRTANLILLGPRRLIEEEPFCRGIEAIDWDAPIYSIREQATFPHRKLRAAGVAAIHSPHYNFPLRAPGLKRLVTVHDLIHILFSEHLGHLKNLYARFMFRRLAESADIIFTVSHHTRIDLENLLGISPGRVTLTPNAVGQDFLKRPQYSDIEAARKKYRLPPRYLLTVGIDKPHKNYAFLVEVLATLWKNSDGIPPLVMAGIPPESSQKYSAMCSDSSPTSQTRNLYFPGRIEWEDLAAVYAGATMLIVPSLYEGFGLPVLEANALGVPVAASNAASLPEVCGDSAVLFPPDNIDQAASDLLQTLTSEERLQQLADLGPLNCHRYSWKKTAEVLADAYYQFLA